MEFEGKGMDVFLKITTYDVIKGYGVIGLVMGNGFSFNRVRCTNLKKIICILK
jgi:hypothetical protein